MSPKRGDIVECSGATGLYVGARNSVEWIAWEGEDFATVCEAFDAKGSISVSS